MKKLLLLFGFLTLLFAGTLPATAQDTAQKGEKSFTITFKTAENNEQSDASSPSDIIVDESLNYVSGLSSVSKASAGTGGLKLGTSSKNGSVTMSISEEAQVVPTKIVVNALRYSSTGGTFDAANDIKISFNDSQKKTLGTVGTSPKDFTWEIITIDVLKELCIENSAKRVFVKSVTVYYKDEQGGETPVDPIDPDPTPSDTPQTLFHETFGDNPGNARVWSDEYSVKSGVESVYNNAKYTITNAKQTKNSGGETKSGLTQTTKGKDASFIVGPLHLASASNVTASYQWKAASIKGTYTTSIAYSTDGGTSYTEIPHSATGATSYTKVSVTVPTPLSDNTYFKVIFNTSNTGALIDEFDIAGVLVTPSTTEIAYDDIAKIADLENGAEVKITDAYVVEIDGEKSVVVYDKSNGNISAIYAIVLDENAEHSFVANRIHNVIGTVAKDGETISIVDAVIADSNDPMLAIDTMPAISFEDNGEPTQGGAQYIHKPVTISHAFHAAGNATIYYTRDGSTPDIKNAREENAAASARSRAEGEEEESPIADPTLDKGTFVYSGPFYAIHPNNWQNITHGNPINIKAVAVPTMAGAHLWNASDVAEMSQGITTGITDINAADADATYYTIQGIRVDAPAAGNIYIRVANGRAAKVRF